MKKFVISGVLAAAVLLLAGCVHDTQTLRIPVNIGFDPVIGHDTRAEESVPFPEDRTFNVWAINEDNADTYLEDELISYGTEGWLSSRSWPQNELFFEAYSPSDLDFDFSSKTGLTLMDFDSSHGNVDILVAQADYADVNIDSLVTMSFEHALSRVEFRMQHALSPDMSVRLRKISMIGFSSKGTFNSRESDPWSVGEKDFSYVVLDDAEGVMIQSESKYVGNEFYTIPQLCNARVEVEFDVRNRDGGWIPQTEVIKELDTYWEPNTHYTYTLNLTETKLTYTTGISTWSNRNE